MKHQSMDTMCHPCFFGSKHCFHYIIIFLMMVGIFVVILPLDFYLFCPFYFKIVLIFEVDVTFCVKIIRISNMKYVPI
jgi:hypothetical protein